MEEALIEKIEREPSWPELLGCNNWDGLLDDPVNLGLRHFILRCGNFCQATYDAFNYDVKSQFAGSSNYGKKNFFHKVMLESAANYQVECFLYATAEDSVAKHVLTRSLAPRAWDRKSNFMGYIATTTDEVSRALGRREIYVVWRGTAASSEWKAEFNVFLASAEDLLADKGGDGGWCRPKVKVESGFLKLYLSSAPPYAKYNARTQVQKTIHRLREKYKHENPSIIVTGHSLGASLSVLSAFDLVENEVKDIPVTAIVFACPKVGNRAFRNRVNSHPNLKILHIKNTHDLIPCVPCTLLGYVNTGINLVIDNNISPSLKRSRDMWDWHNLEAMLHVIAGRKVERCLALVNKHSDLLIDDELVPPSWWVQENKGMVRDEGGAWVHAPPSEEDMPVPENFDYWSSII